MTPSPDDLAGVERIGGVAGGADSTRSMISTLYGWSANSCLRLVHRHLRAHERLVRLDDLAASRASIALEVVVVERLAVGQVEVVVEAVLDGRADRELGARGTAG